jgi:outer membrane protein TolC
MANHDDIKRRAYELYEKRGREDRRDLDDWLQAEREVESIEHHSMRRAAATSNAAASPRRRRVDQQVHGIKAVTMR